MFSKVLVANRGEIAVRIIRACKEMGLSTVAVFSEADGEALHVSLADEAYCIGAPAVTESYLNMTSILSAAAISGAQAIHPGYGLLSENAKFADLCEQCNIKFIGPSAEVISKMGDKDQAKRTMKNAGVPVVPGSEACFMIDNVAEAQHEANQIGYPLLIKARSGGGGRGIRLVKRGEDFANTFVTAASEAQSAFGDSGMYLEKFLYPVKHIEMQILGDSFGNVICLGERECSMQRRNQKVLEESPSPAISPLIRQKMIEVSTQAAKAVGYEGAGTIEFLYDKDDNFYFMEMNTRLQVEHPVTEEVCGIDIVKWQLKIAMGEKINIKQEDVQLSGHAIECRINAENPAKNFVPSCGKITLLHLPGGPGVRLDTAVYQGYEISPFYDSMIAKVIVHAPTRQEAIIKMGAAMEEVITEGVENNVQFQLEILQCPEFLEGTYTTDILSNKG
ncbi:MAG: acetyl-CoA carboxylase biotin carboxylase subunit [Bacillota bacterium]|jgi:acetyl-CoA carboxylase biotin carboxylase subunit